MAQSNLAVTYQDRIRGERAENLEQAIAHFQQAWKFIPQAYLQIGRTQNNLAAPTLTAFAANAPRTWSRPSTTASRPWK